MASQTQCEACNNSLVIIELRAGYLAVLYQLRKSPLSGLCKEPSVACSAPPSTMDQVQSLKIKKRRANNTDMLMWLCGCALTQTVTPIKGHVLACLTRGFIPVLHETQL